MNSSISYVVSTQPFFHLVVQCVLACLRRIQFLFAFLTIFLCTHVIVKRHQVLEDVTEYENSPDGVVKTKLDRILLNGGNVCMLVPGSDGPEAATAS